MIPISVREIIIKDLEAVMKVCEISRILRVHEATIYRLKARYRKTGSIEPNYEPCGKKSELDEQGLERLKNLVLSQPDITLEEIRETMQLKIKKSEISHILRNKLGFRYKKNGSCKRAKTLRCPKTARIICKAD